MRAHRPESLVEAILAIRSRRLFFQGEFVGALLVHIEGVAGRNDDGRNTQGLCVSFRAVHDAIDPCIGDLLRVDTECRLCIKVLLFLLLVIPHQLALAEAVAVAVLDHHAAAAVTAGGAAPACS